MKKTYLITVVALVSLIFTSSFAQGRKGERRGNGNCEFNNKTLNCQVMDLSDEQQQKMDAERVNFMKAIQAERNQLNELQAKKQTIETTDPVNKKELDKTLVTISTLKSSIQKKKIRHHQTIKSFLDDDQLVRFENRGYGHQGYGKGEHRMAKQGQGNREGHANFHGKGKGQGNKGQRPAHGQRADSKLMTEDLRASFKTAHIEMMKKMQPYENQLNELSAQLKTGCTGKDIDLKKVDKLIDEQANVRLEMAKIKTNFKLDLRSQLTDEQKVMFDSRAGRGHKGHGHHNNFN